jgi:ATP-dependent helicase HrpB
LLVLLASPWDWRTSQTVRQVRRMVNPQRQQGRDEDALLMSVLAAFPDRVARRRQGSELQLAAGGPAQLAPASTVTTEEFLVAVEAEDRRDRKAPLVRIASGIRPEWLLDLFPERVRETRQVEWNRAAERVESVSALWFDQIAIEESRGIADPEAAAALLASKAMEAGVARFDEIESVDAFLNRARFAAEHGAVPLPDPEAALRELAAGLKSFGELESAARGALVRTMERQLPPPARRLLEEIAPERIKLPRGRSVAVHYEAGQAPWIASRLQDFFGMRSTPTVARGAVPVVVRLLAPNQRPVQMTTDLAGFWERLYPQVRRELSRRYPRHAWPEDPG